MRRALAALITVVIGAGMLWTGLRRNDRSDQIPSAAAVAGPQRGRSERSDAVSRRLGLAGATERIEGLLDCARRGDVKGYLSAFAAPMRARLEQQVEERGLEAFAAELRRFSQLKKSHAVFAAEPAGLAFESVRVSVETTFPDRIERQTYRLERCDAGWLVSEVERARDHVPKNAVGSWATFREPEGVPVPTAPMAEVDNQENP